MVNYRRVVCEVAVVAALLAVVAAAPAPDCREPHTHYDQRQNGSENYRLNIDGVVIAVAPAESLMSALTDMNDLLDLALEEYNQDYHPKPPQSTPASEVSVALIPTGESKPEQPLEEKPQEEKPQEEKPQEKPDEPQSEASPLSDVSLNSDLKGQKKDASLRKQEKAQRLKNRLATFLMPLLRKTRHH